jgi:ABC-type nitrate/sulfonate/bicarbonate transport system permease component
MAGLSKSDNWRSAFYGTLSFCILAAVWQVIGASGAAGLTVPSLSSVLKIYQKAPLVSLLIRSAQATVRCAALGFVFGALMGVCAALVTRLLPVLRPGLDRLAVLLNAVPVIALGPIFIILAGRELTPAILAAIPTFFLVFVASATGLASSSPMLIAMMTAFGARRRHILCYLDVPAAIPSLLNGLKVSVSSSMIGAIVGEWFGAPTGLGVVILNALENFQVPLMWATILIVASISLSGYGVLTLAERWAERRFT